MPKSLPLAPNQEILGYYCEVSKAGRLTFSNFFS